MDRAQARITDAASGGAFTDFPQRDQPSDRGQDKTRDVDEASWAWGRGRGQKEWGRGRGRGPKNFFEAEAEATMYEAEAWHVREQLSVYEHEDQDIVLTS